MHEEERHEARRVVVASLMEQAETLLEETINGLADTVIARVAAEQVVEDPEIDTKIESAWIMRAAFRWWLDRYDGRL